MIRLWTIHSAKQFLLSQIMGSNRHGTDGVVNVYVIVGYEVVDFFKSTIIRSFPLGFCWVMIGLAFLMNGSVVMIPYLFNRANSTSIASSKMRGAGRLWLYAALSSMGVNLISKWFLLPMSNRCLAKVWLIWTSRSSMEAFVCWSSIEFAQSKFDKNWFRDFWFAWWSSL